MNESGSGSNGGSSDGDKVGEDTPVVKDQRLASGGMKQDEPPMLAKRARVTDSSGSQSSSANEANKRMRMESVSVSVSA